MLPARGTLTACSTTAVGAGFEVGGISAHFDPVISRFNQSGETVPDRGPLPVLLRATPQHPQCQRRAQRYVVVSCKS